MTNLNSIAIIQARMASSRLPDKVLLDIAGQSMLVRVVERTGRAETIDHVVVATTHDENDDPLEDLCLERNYACYRGSTYDVLDRYYQAALIHEADLIVRITADCPVIDPQVIDKTVNSFLGLQATVDLDEQSDHKPRSKITGPPYSFPYDFAANRLPPPWGRTYPIGLDTEVCTFRGLEQAWHEAVQPHQREHVMPFFYEQPERFRILHVKHDPNYGHLRWTVDTPQDLELVRQIYAHFTDRDHFSWLEILDLFESHPALSLINTEVQHKDYREIDTRK